MRINNVCMHNISSHQQIGYTSGPDISVLTFAFLDGFYAPAWTTDDEILGTSQQINANTAGTTPPLGFSSSWTLRSNVSAHFHYSQNKFCCCCYIWSIFSLWADKAEIDCMYIAQYTLTRIFHAKLRGLACVPLARLLYSVLVERMRSKVPFRRIRELK